MASVARAVAVGLKRPLQVEIPPSSRLPLNVLWWAFFREPRSRALEDGRCALCRASTPARGVSRSARCGPCSPSDGLSRDGWSCLHMPTDGASRGGEPGSPELFRGGGGSVSSPRHASLSATGLQSLGLCGGGSLSPTCKSDAGGAFGGGRCAVRVQRRAPWFVRLDDRAFDGLRARVPSCVDRPEAYSLLRPGVFTQTGQLQGFKTSFDGTFYGGSAFARCNAACAGVERRRNRKRVSIYVANCI